MAVVTLDEIVSTVRSMENEENGETVLKLIEDVSDTMNAKDAAAESVVVPNYESDDNPYKAKYTDIREKYISRFTHLEGSPDYKETKKEEIDYMDKVFGRKRG